MACFDLIMLTTFNLSLTYNSTMINMQLCSKYI